MRGRSIKTRKRAAVLVAALVAAIAAPVAQGAATSVAGRFLASIFYQQAEEDAGFGDGSGGGSLHLYATLIPAQRRFIPMAHWLACNPQIPPKSGTGFSAPEILKELSQRSVSMLVPGTAVRVSAVEVAFHVSASTGQNLGVARLHTARVGGRWRWMMSATYLRRYKQGGCP